MTKLSISSMEKLEGSAKCFYHGLAASGSLLFGLTGLALYIYHDGDNFVKCWKNQH